MLEFMKSRVKKREFRSQVLYQIQLHDPSGY